MKNSKKSLVVIDDDHLFCDTVRYALQDLDIMVQVANTGGQGLELCAKAPVDVVLLDQKLPDARGIDLCSPILNCHDSTQIIFITAYPSFQNAVQAIKVGAHDYLSKPFEMDELTLTVKRALRTIDLERLEQVQHYENKKEIDSTVLIGATAGLRSIQHMVELASVNQSPVLITGETGTGKSLVAKSIHLRGNCKGPFIAVNCAAIPESLMEAELFGYEKGAFTGAEKTTKGLFEMAEAGTLFLDEIGELPLHLQAKLLGALDDKKIRRLGGQSLKPVNLRIIAATNADIKRAVKERRFREDLFYRLSVVLIHMPPLRQRQEDLPDLCRYFISQIAPDQQIRLSDEQVEKMQTYSWPGNVRELRNIIERAIIVRKGSVIEPFCLVDQSLPAAGRQIERKSCDEILTLQVVEKQHIAQTLHQLNGNHTRTAKALGISRSTLMRKMKIFGL